MDELIKATRKTPKFTIKGRFLAKCVSVYDGDTIQAVFKYAGVLYRFSCRMAGYNCAEMRSSDPNEVIAANKAKDALTDLLLDQVIILHADGFDKYGRLLIDVELNDTTGNDNSRSGGYVNVRDYMIHAGYGKHYDGTGEKNW